MDRGPSETGREAAAVYEHPQGPGSQRSVWIALCAAIGIALGAGFVVTTVLEVSDTVAGDVFKTLTQGEPQRDPGDLLLVISDGPPTGVGRGMQLALFGLLVGGVPAAILSAALVAYGRKSRKSWSGNWTNVFLVGFVFQLSSLALAMLLMVLLGWYAIDSGAGAGDVLPFGGFLGLSLLCGAAALRFWRELQDSVQEEPLRIMPVSGASG